MATPNLKVALVGGTGFIGRATATALRERGCQVVYVARHQPSSLAEGEAFMAADITNPTQLQQALAGTDTVIHLVAMLAERDKTFEQIIHQGTRTVAQAARAAGVKHVVYVSALGANLQSPSRYARAKAQAEAAVLALYPSATIVRPSLVIGQGGGFTRQVSLLTRFAPVMVLPGYGRTRFQPVGLSALAKQLANACLNPPPQGQIINAVGPQVQTFRQLASEELHQLGRSRLLLPLPWFLTWGVAYAMQAVDHLTAHHLLPEWLLVTPDQVRLLQKDNIA